MVNTNPISKTDKVLGFILGLLVCEGISVVFTVGSTSFTLVELYSPLLCIWLCFHNQYALPDFFGAIPTGFKLFWLVLLFSIIPGLIYFMTFSVISRYLVGVIYFLIILTTAVDAYILRSVRSSIFAGIFAGILLNVIYTIICYISFNAGTVITLSNMISRDAFYVPVLNFRSQGFFLEPSHFIRFIISVGIIVLSEIKIKSVFLRILICGLAFIALIFSYSGSLVILFFGLLLYFLGTRKRKLEVSYQSLFLALIVLVFVIMFAFSSNWRSFYGEASNTFNRIISGADITNEENYLRYDSILTFLEYPDAYLLGCGWNLTGTFIQVNGLNTVSAFSDILELFLETGLLGGFIYSYAVISLCGRLWSLGDQYPRALSVSLLMIFMLQIGTD
ncbi:MAG: hypothetical protein LUD27_09250, partial [Clostridia bacterium]|nr:hypothetical protein [Clostridia bacterium]